MFYNVFMILSLVLALSISFSGDVTPALAKELLAAPLSADERFRVQIVAGQYEEAQRTMAENPAAVSLPYQVYVAAKMRQQRDGVPFEDAFRAAFREVVGAADARVAAHSARWVFGTSPVFLADDWKATLAKHAGKTTLTQAEAVELVRKQLAATVYGDMAPLTDALFVEDDERRYIIERNIRIPSRGGAEICGMLMRPRVEGKLPALLNFTIYVDETVEAEARRSAAHGYVGVEGFTRGKGCSPAAPVPVEYDGQDAAALIDWISKQPWSNGKVGMYGGSYEGFTQWAAAKYMPAALKAMMPPVTFAPGIDFPMERGIFFTYAYPWPYYTTNFKDKPDNATYYDKARWDRMQREWYVSGKPYRDLQKIDGTPNPIFARWASHPTYDDYWRNMIPQGDEFKRIDIPVLTTTGYYDGGQLGALHYFRQHYRMNPNAQHYLVVGPYDHISGQRGTVGPSGRKSTMLRGYELDSVAHIDIFELRYQWFDHVLRGGPRPALLRDKVNYQVMGSNAWKHAPSLDAMHTGTLPLRPRKTIEQVVDLADRTDVDRYFRGELFDHAQDTWLTIADSSRIGNSIEFLSEPLTKRTEVSGLFSGRLDVQINKRDFDFNVTLFEVTREGKYFLLNDYWARASHVNDRSVRRLLKPGRKTRLEFTNERLTSRVIEPGSRIAAVIGIIKQPGVQLNYGTGGDVKSESIADAKEPLRIRWYATSVVNVPIATP